MSELIKKRAFFPILILSLLLLPFLYFINQFSPPGELIPPGYGSSILALELVQNPKDLGEVLDLLSPEQIEGLDRINYLDFGFMLVYSLVLFLFAKKLQEQSLSVPGRIALFIPIIILLSDLFENLQMLHLTELYRTGNEEYYTIHISQLQMYTWMKWGNLALYFLLTGLHIIRPRMKMRWIGLPMLAPMGLLILSYLYPLREIWDFLANSIFFMFGLIFLYCLLYKTPDGE